MLKDRIPRFIEQSMELFVSMFLVVICFSILMALLNAFFPTGTSLKNIMMQGENQPTGKNGRRPLGNLLFAHGNQEYSFEDQPDFAAVLWKIKNNVKSKRAGRIAWTSATEGMPLFSLDAIQTLKRSNAHIRFDDQNHIDMVENSLVIINRLEQDLLFNEKRTLIVVVDGALRGKLSKKDHQSVSVEIETPDAVATIRTRKIEDGQADFKVSVNPDKSSTITVYQGSAEFIAQGQRVKVEENQASIVLPGQSPSLPVNIPKPVDLLTPVDGTIFAYRHLPPKIRFSWKPREGIERYSITLARDPNFEEIIYQERLSQAQFSHGNLTEGDYYWKVTAIQDSIEGKESQRGQFRVIQDLSPPLLHVEFPSEIVFNDQTLITGRTEKGSRLYIMGKPVQINKTGQFNYPLKLQHGINVIVVEAVDTAGNINYRSRLVNGKF